MTNLPTIAVALLIGIASGSVMQSVRDQKTIDKARQNEAQANGLEDQCKAKLSTSWPESFSESPNGDYTLSIYGGRRLICEEHPLTVNEPTADSPLTISCNHGE